MYRFYVNCHQWTPTRDEWLFGSRCITGTELDRIHQFVFQRDAKFAFAGQLLIRYILAKGLERPSSTFVIKRTDRRRPYVESNPPFDFNLSHHHQLVCLAATFDGRVGCDTMEYRTNETRKESMESLTNLLKREFSQEEYNFILKNNPDEATRIRHFYRLWCLKESFVKWSGDGIDSSLARLDFRIQTKEFDSNDHQQVISSTTLNLIKKDFNPNQLRFDEQIIYLPNNEQQIITVCSSTTNPCQPFVELTMQEILQACSPLDEHPVEVQKWWINFSSKKNS